MRPIAAPLLILAMLAPARGEDRRPLVVVSFAGQADIAADLDALGAAIDAAGLAATVGAELSRLTRVASLDGLDGGRRWGAALLVDGPLIAPVAMVPVSDVASLLANVAPLVGDVERPAGRPIEIGRGEWTGYIAVRDGWAYVAQTPDDLAELPDAAALLAPPRPDVDVALTLYPRRLPEAYRTMAIDALRAELRERAAAGVPPSLGDRALHAVERTLTDVERVTWSFSLDGERRRAVVESELLALPETPWAATIAALGERSAPGLPFGDDEAGMAALAVRWPGAKSSAWEQALEAFYPNATRQQVRKRDAVGAALAEAFDGADRAALDVDLEAWGDESPPTFTVALQLPDERRATLLAERLEGIAAQTPGESAPRVARRGARVALSAGPLAEERLAAALAAPARRTAGIDGRLRLQPLLAAVRQNDDGDWNPALTPLLAMLAGFDDRVALSVRGEGRRLESRLELPEGAVRLAAAGLYFAALRVPLVAP